MAIISETSDQWEHARRALIEGEKSGVSSLSVGEIWQEVERRYQQTTDVKTSAE